MALRLAWGAVHHCWALTTLCTMLCTLLTLTLIRLEVRVLLTLTSVVGGLSSGSGGSNSGSLTFLLRTKHLCVLNWTVLHPRAEALHRRAHLGSGVHLSLGHWRTMSRHTSRARHTSVSSMRTSMLWCRHVRKIRSLSSSSMHSTLAQLLPLPLLHCNRITNQLPDLIRRRLRVLRSITRLNLRHRRCRTRRLRRANTMMLLRVWRRLRIRWGVREVMHCLLCCKRLWVGLRVDELTSCAHVGHWTHVVRW